MIELTTEQKLFIAITFLSDRDVEMYSTACRYVEQGMSVDEAIDEVVDEYEA